MVRLVVVFAIFSISLCLGSDLHTPSNSSTKTQGYSKNAPKEGLTKRGIKVENLSGNNYNDPPPEYYRGSASSSSHISNRDNTVVGYLSRPVAFPEGKYGYKAGSTGVGVGVGVGVTTGGGGAGVGGGGGGGGGFPGQQERKALHDRISIGHYGTNSGHNGYGAANHGYEATSVAHTYGPPQAIEYEYYTPTGNGHHGYSEGGETIPIELYNRGYGGYGHTGEYATYTTATDHRGGGHTGGGYQSGKHGYDKALLAKSFLIPLASAAVLGIAAALASNPLLLQLGTVSSIGKRKKRELKKKTAQAIAYRSQRRN